ncbi:hypothetical protein Q6294_29995, partial [Klebsiella pneumoniae]
MASSTTTIPNSVDPQTHFLIINLNRCIKLTPHTYRSWTTQIEDVLFGFDLFHFVDVSHPCPACVTVDEEKTEQPNLAYQTWVRQDR